MFTTGYAAPPGALGLSDAVITWAHWSPRVALKRLIVIWCVCVNANRNFAISKLVWEKGEILEANIRRAGSIGYRHKKLPADGGETVALISLAQNAQGVVQWFTSFTGRQ